MHGFQWMDIEIPRPMRSDSPPTVAASTPAETPYPSITHYILPCPRVPLAQMLPRRKGVPPRAANKKVAVKKPKPAEEDCEEVDDPLVQGILDDMGSHESDDDSDVVPARSLKADPLQALGVRPGGGAGGEGEDMEAEEGSDSNGEEEEGEEEDDIKASAPVSRPGARKQDKSVERAPASAASSLAASPAGQSSGKAGAAAAAGAGAAVAGTAQSSTKASAKGSRGKKAVAEAELELVDLDAPAHGALFRW